MHLRDSQRWTGRYTRILTLYMRGKSGQEIAATVGLSPETVARICTSDLFKTKQAEFELKVTEKARKLFEDKALEAAQKVVRLMKEGKPDEKLQFEAAKEILYQVGIKPIEVIETRKREYTPEELASALAVTKEMEAIADRLAKQSSPFLVEQSEESEPSSPAPVLSGTVEEVKVEEIAVV